MLGGADQLSRIYCSTAQPCPTTFTGECDLSRDATLKLVSLIYSSRSLLCGTDGGLLNGLGTFGYVWGDSTKVDALLPFGKGHVPGASLIMSSTRTEMSGLFAALTHLRLVVEYFHIIPKENASCRIYCDSKAALTRVVDNLPRSIFYSLQQL
jgi:hypothetical protein